MTKRIEENKSLVQVYWPEVRRYVAKINPIFTELVDKLNFDSKEFPLYIARYPYGASLGGGKGAILPTEEGNLCRLLDIHFSNEIMRNLGYGKNSLPLGLVLDKQMEYCLDLKDQKLTLPMKVYKPGEFFSLNGTLRQQRKYNGYSVHSLSNSFFSSFAGARSALMLPNITAKANHQRLKYKLKIDHGIPKCLYEHGTLFKAIANSEALKCHWKMELLYFSESWKKSINENSDWSKIRIYLEDCLYNVSAFEKDHVFYSFLFSLLQQDTGIKSCPFLTDTAHWLFTIASGTVPAYAPATDNEIIPLSTLQYAYSYIYQLEEYLPIIMIPEHFSLNTGLPLYYPLKYPSMPRFPIRSRKSATTLADMRGLDELLNIFEKIFAQQNNLYYSTILGEISRKISFTPFHCDYDKEKIVKSTKELPNTDNRFNITAYKLAQKDNPTFPGDASFLKGCIKIQKK